MKNSTSKTKKKQDSFFSILNINVRSLAYDNVKNKRILLASLKDSDELSKKFINEISSNSVGLSQKQINTYLNSINLLLNKYLIKYTDDIEHYLYLIGSEIKGSEELNKFENFKFYIGYQHRAAESILDYISRNSFLDESYFSSHYEFAFFDKINDPVEYYMILMIHKELPKFENEINRRYKKFQIEFNNNLILLSDPINYLNQLLEHTNTAITKLKKNDFSYEFSEDEIKAYFFEKYTYLKQTNQSTLLSLMEQLAISINLKNRTKYFSNISNDIDIETSKIELSAIIQNFKKIKKNLLFDLKKNIEDLISSKRKSISTIPTKSFNNKVFKTHAAQNVFYNALIEFRAIDNSNLPISRKFQPICNAIYDKDSKYFVEMFVYGLQKKEYITFLESDFSITIKDKSKLSDGYRHKEKVSKFILSSLTET